LVLTNGDIIFTSISLYQNLSEIHFSFLLKTLIEYIANIV